MELSWPIKARIAAVALVGIFLIGILCWNMVSPSDPYTMVRMPGFGKAIILGILSVAVGFMCYFAAWPYGREIGVLAVPCGLIVWGLRSGSIAEMLQQMPLLSGRGELFASIKWEALFWLAIVGAGAVGVLLGQFIYCPKAEPSQDIHSHKSIISLGKYRVAAIAFFGAVVFGQIFISIFAAGVHLPDNIIGSVVSQPAGGQIAFGVIAAFCIIEFLLKFFFDAGCLWPIIASGFVIASGQIFHAGGTTLGHLSWQWPAVFFSNSVMAILPVQMVSFAVIGTVIGFWIAVRYGYWRKHGI